ncbi:MAG: DEAD/DEAH box helicase [Legionella sp.]|nr:DEAD/DEAH box helicase [Legionella sp.]
MARLILAPSGLLHIAYHFDGEDSHADVHQAPIVEAFLQSQEQGLLQLLTSKIDNSWSLALKYWRNYIAMYASQLCNFATQSGPIIDPIPPPNETILNDWLLKIPPMPGGEYLTTDLLASIWLSLDAWCREFIASNPEGITGFLKKHLPAWQQVGRVCFNLAENKQDPNYPFAFIATYTASLTASRDVQHKPLRDALQEYAGNTNKLALYNLLKPIQTAATQCEWVREVLDSHDIYHPMAWTSGEAYQLLQSIPQLEAAGLVVKCPDWWKKRLKPRVQVNIGGKKNTLLSADTLLNFNVMVAIDGEPLSREELDAIYQSETGLIMLRGQYVEIDKEKLQQALDHWQSIQKKAGTGLSFIEGMRLLAGVGSDLVDTDFSEELHEWSTVQASESLRAILESIRHPETIQTIQLGSELKATLRPYQAIGVNWLDLLTNLGLGACLADDMGLGKTIQVIALLLLQKKKKLNNPSLLVLPASLLGNWKSEMQRFAPTLKVLFFHSSELHRSDLEGIAANALNTLGEWDLVVTTYGMLQGQSWLTRTCWHLIILDEAQAIKNPASEQTKLTKTLKGHAKIALTGTPIENRLGDLWSLYDFICPGLLGTSSRFKQFIKSIETNDKASYAPLRQLIQPYLLRRLKTDKSIIDDLPDKTEMKVWCALSKEQLKLYTQAVFDMKRALESTETSIQRKGLVLAYLTRFKQICNHPGQLLGDKDYHEKRSGKFERLAYLYDEIATRQEKVLIFTQYREMTVAITTFLEQRFGAKGLILHGGTPVTKRKELVDQFQEEQGPPFFVLSLKAGGTGLNLTAASHVIHFDRWWNPAVENQATDRAFRIGQKRNVLVHKMICKGTIEEKIDQLIAEKVSLASDLLQVNGESLLTEMNDQQLLDLVRLDINQIMDEEIPI